MSNTSELACTYAALILHDDGIEITAEKIAKLVKAANVNVESYWPSLFAKLFREEQRLIMNVGASGDAAAPVASNVPTAAQAVPAAEETKNKKKEEVKEESEDDMVFGLFD
uniref:60S acidic ribosomal protein P1 n=1 Tax=Brassica oleracea TaxID=3712 RepID=A0A3P6DP70_BRAOL|nr:unnamed protein product [Brassica oleracea]